MAEIDQKYAFPRSLYDGIETCLALTGYSYTRPEALAKAVMQLSTFYVQFPKKVTPWSEPWCQAAYLSYYLPLNWWRVSHAVSRGLERSFFDGLESLLDFGSGLGSAGFALSHQGVLFPAGSLCIEKSDMAVGLHRKLHGIESNKIHWQS
ncbi:MAG: hypothetical protein NTV34_18960, partial [Proteobacteria bacterium]|nr:hypothetical protein [Pseudomonadota bacterium]